MLLRDADPLPHEATRLDAERARIRRTILEITAIPRPPVAVHRRVPVAATLALAVAGIALLGYLPWVRGTTPILAAVRFEVRLAEDRPTPGLVVERVSASGDVLYLHPEIVVSNDDIADSWVLDEGTGRFGVAVQLLPAGAERMRRATAAHVNRPVAILIDGRVAMAPVVRSPIGDSAVISGSYTRAEAERIAEGISRR
jgi:hypothetical protein